MDEHKKGGKLVSVVDTFMAVKFNLTAKNLLVLPYRNFSLSA